VEYTIHNTPCRIQQRGSVPSIGESRHRSSPGTQNAERLARNPFLPLRPPRVHCPPPLLSAGLGSGDPRPDHRSAAWPKASGSTKLSWC